MATLSQSREQQAVQQGLIALMLQDLGRTWSALDARKLGQTLPRWITSVLSVVTRYGEASGGLGLDFYDAERDAAGVRGAGPSPMLRLPEREQVEASLRWATKNLWDDHVLEPDDDFDRLLRQMIEEEAAADLAAMDDEDLADLAEEPTDEPEPDEDPADLSPAAQRLQKARSKVDGVASRLVTGVGRGAVVDAAAEDRKAIGCARIAAPNACAFCRMTAIRGVVYKDEQTAGRNANAKFTGASEFKYHDHCRCQIAPYFEGEEWQPQPQIAEWEQQYRQARALRGDVLGNWYRIVRASQ
ncbi:VG15 protein [Spirillospora sp. NBC_01491]|uniref:VG15 protein n=1 Tax=Spirillospora sp. NBC_01491 TaxID=2976007 RepID=UPI002E32B44B|nr:hypothetical protein [Spirillospora sp. NBC_01491]